MPVYEAPLGPAPGRGPSIACNGDMCLVVWRGGAGILGARISTQGALLDPLPFVISGAGESPRALWNGERFLVLWQRDLQHVHGRFVHPSEGIDPGFLSVTRGRYSRFDAASNRDLIVVVAGGRYAEVVRRDGSGVLLTVQAASDRRLTRVENNGDEFVIAGFFEPATGARSGFLTRWKPGNELMDPPVPTAYAEIETIVAHDDGYTLLQRTSQGQLVAQRFGAALEPGAVVGVIMSERPLEVSALPLDGDRIAIVWQSGQSATFGELKLTILGSDDAIATVSLGVNGTAPALVRSTGGLMLVWSDAWVHHAMLEPETGDLESPAVLSRGRPFQSHADAVGTETGWFLTWKERDGRSSAIRARIVAPEFAPLEPFTVAASTADIGEPVITEAPGLVLVSWREHGPAILGRRYLPDGTALDDEPIVVASSVGAGYGAAKAPAHSVVWNGRYFILAWTTSEYPGQLRVTRITSDGVVIDPDGKPVIESERGTFQSFPSIAVSGEITMLVWQDGDATQYYDCSILCPSFPEARTEAVRLDIEANPLERSAVRPSNDHISAIPVVAAADGRFLLVWRTTDRITGSILLEDGMIYGHPFEIASVRSPWGEIDVTGTDGRFFVVWADGDEVHGRRIGSRGVLFESARLVKTGLRLSLDMPGLTPRVASRGEDLLLLYTRESPGAGGAFQSYMRAFRIPHVRERGITRR